MALLIPGKTLNNANWFGYPNYIASPSTGVQSQPYTLPLSPVPADICSLMLSVGFKSMRLFVDPVPFIYLTGTPLANAYTLLNSTINTVTGAGIQVIVCMAPPQTERNAGTWATPDLFTVPSYFSSFNTCIGAMASNLSTVNTPSMVCLELLNEPTTTDNADWQSKLGTLAGTARSANASITIVASGNNTSFYQNLTFLTPLADANVIYTFHYYEPFTFTHQGASFVSAPVSGFSKLPYPPLLIGAQGTLPSGGDASWLSLLGLFAWGHNQAVIVSEFATILAWCTTNSISPTRIFVGEFGVHMPGIGGGGALNQDRANYVSAVAFAAGQALFSWGFFHVDGEFGILQATTPLSFDPLILAALNLGSVQGRVIGTITSQTPGSTLSLTDSHSGAVQLVGNVLQVGPTLPAGVGSFNIIIMETLAGAPNSPRSTTLSITVNPAF